MAQVFGKVALVLLAALAWATIFSFPAHAGLIEGSSLYHSTRWVHVSDQSQLGGRMDYTYRGIAPRSLDGASHSYIKAKYKPRSQDVSLGYEVDISNDLTLGLQLSTGSKAEKMEVAPHQKVSMRYKAFETASAPKYYGDQGSYSAVVLHASYIFGGELREKTCTDSSGLAKEFNCRTALPVSMSPVMKADPMNRMQVGIRYVWVGDFL